MISLLLRQDPYVYFAAMVWGMSFLAIAKSIPTHVDHEIDPIHSRQQQQTFFDRRLDAQDGEEKPKESES